MIYYNHKEKTKEKNMKKTLAEEIMTSAKTLKEFNTYSKTALMEMKCRLENWNLFDCEPDGTVTIIKQYY